MHILCDILSFEFHYAYQGNDPTILILSRIGTRLMPEQAVNWFLGNVSLLKLMVLPLALHHVSSCSFHVFSLLLMFDFYLLILDPLNFYSLFAMFFVFGINEPHLRNV